jgi:hypothetical protein
VESENLITIKIDDVNTITCDSIIIIPKKSLEEAGYIKTFSLQAGGNDKHEFHAMSQVVYYQFQDDELEVEYVDHSLTIVQNDESETVDDGIVIYRDLEGAFHVLSLQSEMIKKFLETGFRFCTRWVRLDI